MRFAAVNNRQGTVSDMKARVLIVPGFVADTYSEIERGLVELSAKSNADVEFIWLVPEASWKHNRFARPENRRLLSEPVWVPHLRQHGVRYVVGNISKYDLISNFLLFRRIFKENRIDAVYTHFGFERFWAAFFGKLWGKVVVWHERWHSLGTRYVMPKRVFYRFFVDEFIAISRFITSTLPHGRHVHTVPNATRTSVPVCQNPDAHVELRRKLGVPDGAKLVLMVANFRGWKRHMLAFDICERVLRERSDVTFVFLGEGEVRQPFLARVKGAALDRHITAPGYVDNVDDYYAIASLSMLTSYYEPFGNVVLESMRQAVPVIAFNNGGPSEVIQDGKTGFLVREGDVGEFAQKIIELVDDGLLRAAMGESARQVVEQQYSRDSWINRISGLLKDIVIEYRAKWSLRRA